MSRKKDRTRRRADIALDTPQERELLFARRGFKQALKDAKVAYRQQPTEGRRRLLECAFFGRAQELHRYGLRDECRAVLANLLELGVTDPSVQRDLPEVLLSVGMYDRYSMRIADSTENNERLLVAAADLAVLRPQEAAGSFPGVRGGPSRACRARRGRSGAR